MNATAALSLIHQLLLLLAKTTIANNWCFSIAVHREVTNDIAIIVCKQNDASIHAQLWPSRWLERQESLMSMTVVCAQSTLPVIMDFMLFEEKDDFRVRDQVA